MMPAETRKLRNALEGQLPQRGGAPFLIETARHNAISRATCSVFGQYLELCASASWEHQRRVVVCGMDAILQPSRAARSHKTATFVRSYICKEQRG